MSIVYEKAADVAPEICDMARHIIERHHDELKLAPGLYATMAIMLASQGDPENDDPPLKDGAEFVFGQIKPIPYVQRVDGRADAEIRLDKVLWGKCTEFQQRARLDYLITFLEPDIGDDGVCKADDAGRPKLRVRAPDFHVKGFRSIARRYGDDSHEVAVARAFERDYGADVLRAPGTPMAPARDESLLLVP